MHAGLNEKISLMRKIETVKNYGLEKWFYFGEVLSTK